MGFKARWIALAAAVALMLACSDGGSEGADPEQDQARAEGVVLMASDLPSGWSSRPHEQLPGETELRSDIARCLGITPLDERATAEAMSDDFTQNMATVSAVVWFVSSEEEASDDAAAYAGGMFPECAGPGYGAQIEAVGPEGNTLSALEITEVDAPEVGDGAVAHRVSAVIQFGEITVPITIDLVHVFDGRAEIELTVVSPGAPFEREFVNDLAEAMADRL